MTKETDYLIQSLFEKESMEEMTLDEFRRIADQYPYSSIIIIPSGLVGLGWEVKVNSIRWFFENVLGSPNILEFIEGPRGFIRPSLVSFLLFFFLA